MTLKRIIAALAGVSMGMLVVSAQEGQHFVPIDAMEIQEIGIGKDGSGYIRFGQVYGYFEQFQSTSPCAGITVSGTNCYQKLPEGCQFVFPLALSKNLVREEGTWVCSNKGCRRFSSFCYLQDLETGEDCPVHFE